MQKSLWMGVALLCIAMLAMTKMVVADENIKMAIESKYASPLDQQYPQDPEFVLHIQSKTDADCYSFIVTDACFEELKTSLAAAGFDSNRLLMPGYHKGQIWVMPVV